MGSKGCLHRALLAVIAALFLAGCDFSEQHNEEEPSVRVAVQQMVPVTLDVSQDLPGRVSALRTADIRPQVSGIVLQRRFEQGAEIVAGSVLFQINPAPFITEVDVAAGALQRARAVLARERLQVRRLEQLVRTEVISRQAYDDAVSLRDQAAADVEQAQAMLARKQLDLAFASVDAPISGRIDQALVSEGALVSPTDSSPMARIQQIDQVYVDVHQSASALETLRETLGSPQASDNGGMAVQILGRRGKPMGLNGRLLFSGINVDPSTGEVLLRILVDNPQRDLLPGMYVQARIPRARYLNALTVPQQAIVRQAGRASVWLVDEHARAHRAPVELGELVDRQYRIVSGLVSGHQVVIEGVEHLKEGARVDVSVPSHLNTNEPADAATN